MGNGSKRRNKCGTKGRLSRVGAGVSWTVSTFSALKTSGLPAHRNRFSDDALRFVATARGEQEYFYPNGIATASEGAKSNALMRCCKDLGIASELWDPRFIRDFKKKHCLEVFVEDAKSGRK